MQRGLSELWTTPSGGLLDGVGGTDLRADRVFAVHAHLRRGLHAVAPLDRFEVDQRAPAVGVAFLARLHAGLAADAARVVDEEGELAHRMPPAAGSSAAMSPAGVGRLRHAHRADLELGNLGDRIDRADRAVVRRPVERPVIRDEHRVGPDGLHDLRADDDRAAAALDADEVAVGDAERRRPGADGSRTAAAGTGRRARRCGASACPTDTATPRVPSSARSGSRRPALRRRAASRPAESAPCRRDGRTASLRTGAACRDDRATGTARRRPSRDRCAPR